MDKFLLSESEKQDLIKRLTQDVTWDSDELVDSEQDVSNMETEDQEGLVY